MKAPRADGSADSAADSADSAPDPADDSVDDARAAAAASVELAARASYGRLIALLAASSGDLALAEDALAGAFEQALRSWPDAGVPDNPEGWLLTVARNRQRDAWKSAERRLTASLDDERVRGGGDAGGAEAAGSAGWAGGASVGAAGVGAVAGSGAVRAGA
ncbi:sigma factor, partial [Agromyces salentinus]